MEAPAKLAEAQAEKQKGASSLTVLRDRVRSMSLLSPSLDAQASERLQVRGTQKHARTPSFMQRVTLTDLHKAWPVWAIPGD